MNNFINIKIKPDAEFRENVLLNKTFTKLHKALHDAKQTTIGVSFPNYKVKLGDTIRLHGDKPSLEALQQSNWLGGLSGYCEVSEILPIPDNIEGYRCVSRKQTTMTLAKMKKRIEYQRAKGVLKTPEDVKAYKRQYKEEMYGSHSLDNPYLELQSTSSGQLYRVFIEMDEIQSNSVIGDFNNFGLSKVATIPWF